MRTVAVLSAALLSAGLFAQDEIPERYQSIIDRQMFGRPPAGFDPAKPPSEVAKSAAKELTKEEEQLKSAVHFSVINITPDGSTAVGFTDSSDPKNPIGYYLKVGETKNGWTVKEADPVNASMTISKGELEVTLELGANSATTPSANAKADGKPAGASGAGLLGKPAGTFGSLRERRAAKDKERAANAEKERKEREERDAARQRELEEMKERIAQRQQDEEARQRELDETRNAIKELQQQIKDNDAQKAERQDEAEGGEGDGGGDDEA